MWATNHETRITAFMFFTRHESRNTKHGFYGRSVRRGCARDAQPETPARTAAPAAQSLLACALWRGMERHIAPEPVSAHRQSFSGGLTTSAVSRKMNPC